MASAQYYLKTGKASDLKHSSDRLFYKFLEIIPGGLAWSTLLGIIIVSRFFPVFASFFIIAFDLYWLLKTVFLSFHLRASHQQMKKNLATNWPDLLNKIEAGRSPINIKHWSEIYHMVILPFFKEPAEVIRDSIISITHSDIPTKDNFILILGIEERAGREALDTAQKLKKEFEEKFFKILITIHPDSMPGEIPGKGSNETWAVKEAKTELIDPSKINYEMVLVSSFDVDTQVFPGYFSCLTFHYLTAEKPLRSSYQPIPIYNNNIWFSPAFSRVVATSGTFWQMMQQARPERLATFSSHSMSLKALVEMNYWHTNIVSEDSRIFWQALLFYDADYRVVPLYYPVSMDANVAPTFWKTAKNVYRQQRRWGWGVENVPYLLFGFWKNKKIPLQKKLFFSFNQLEGFWAWATNSFILFLLGWLPPLIGGAKFGSSVLAHNLPYITRIIMTLAMFGLVTSAIVSTSLLPPRPPGHSIRKYLWMVLQWVLVPVTIIFFGSIPGLEAQTRLMFGKYMSFWVTPKYRGRPETG